MDFVVWASSQFTVPLQEIYYQNPMPQIQSHYQNLMWNHQYYQETYNKKIFQNSNKSRKKHKERPRKSFRDLNYCKCSCNDCYRPKPCCKNVCSTCNNQFPPQSNVLLFPYPVPIVIVPSNKTTNEITIQTLPTTTLNAKTTTNKPTTAAIVTHTIVTPVTTTRDITSSAIPTVTQSDSTITTKADTVTEGPKVTDTEKTSPDTEKTSPPSTLSTNPMLITSPQKGELRYDVTKKCPPILGCYKAHKKQNRSGFRPTVSDYSELNYHKNYLLRTIRRLKTNLRNKYELIPIPDSVAEQLLSEINE
ncbi:uncharacterized protein LOC134199208 [Bombyx mori]|uniref:uncharacterized protein LOC134199208 n=1 Tax=Bombyx mori TaxID=7091 RepID=UPI002ED53F80